MESAGFSCPFTTANVAVVTDEDGRGMRLLTGEMNPGMIYTTEMIVELCRRLGIFEGLVGATDADRGRAQRSAFGKLLARYTHRQVKDVWFIIAGSGHGKRFHVLRSEDYARLHGPHGPTPRSSNNDEIPMG